MSHIVRFVIPLRKLSKSAAFFPLVLVGLCVALLGRQVAAAETSDPPAADTAASANASDKAPPTAGSGTSQTLAEVMVTAQRRSQLAIDVPMAITTLSGTSLEANVISNTRDLAQVTPGLTFTDANDYTTVTLRGIGSDETATGAENNVAIYLDGAPLPSKISGILDLPDVGGIEVLKGPQGTLWGRNATGGAVLINTLNPSFTESGNATVSYGSLDDQMAKVFLTGPLVDGLLAGSVAGYYERQNGYLDNIVTGQRDAGGLKSTMAHVKLLFTPADGVRFIFGLLYMDRIDEDLPLLSYPAGYSEGSSELRVDPSAVQATAPWTASSTFSNLYWKNRTVRENLEGDFDTPWGLLTSITAYSTIQSPGFIDVTSTSGPGAYAFINEPDTTYSEDLNFASNPFGPFDFLAGVDYYHDHVGQQPFYVWYGQPASVIEDYPESVFTQSMDGYFEGNVHITPRLTFIAGARYTNDREEYFGALSYDLAPYVAPAALPRLGVASWDKLTPRVSVKYKLAQQTDAYFTYSQGFKSGTFNFDLGYPAPVNPETVNGFELGIKSHVSPMFSIDASVFYAIYENIQVETISLAKTAPVYDTPITLNAARAQIYGVDFDATYRPIADLDVELKLEPLHATYTSFPDALEYVPTPLSICPPSAAPVGCGGTATPENGSGNYLPEAPTISGTFTADYLLHPKAGDVEVNANLYATGKYYLEDGNRLFQPAYEILNARISWTPHNGATTFSLWGKNLTNSAYVTGNNEVDLAVNWAMPRTVGIQATTEF